MDLAALLFDLDGTLAHTDPLHFLAWREALADHGVEVDEASYARRVSGRHNPEIVADLLPHLSRDEGRAFAGAKEARFRAAADRLEPLPGVHEVLRAARRAGLATALVTNAPRDNAVFMLGALGLEDAFDAVVLGEEAAAPKPDPAPYRETLSRLGVPADRALAFEDSPSGVTSARGAGLPVVGLATTQRPETLTELGASPVVDDFLDARLWSGPLAVLAPYRDDPSDASGA
ncbi:MAG: HAD-IA family hydrolase [Trueperaceae bacterium]|nr:HAD-IA family hydrolase [Trueperaceae bacterium]